jgi:hypothetical protein
VEGGLEGGVAAAVRGAGRAGEVLTGAARCADVVGCGFGFVVDGAADVVGARLVRTPSAGAALVVRLGSGSGAASSCDLG